MDRNGSGFGVAGESYFRGRLGGCERIELEGNGATYNSLSVFGISISISGDEEKELGIGRAQGGVGSKQGSR